MTQWYAIRAAGTVALILLSLTTALGLVNRTRISTPRWPRFIIDRVHRNIALLAVVFLVIHIVTAVTDSFVKIPLLAVVLPFSTSYRPLWVGLGSVALDLLIAITVTSLLRARVGVRVWRAVHWLGYACWPVAVIHGLGNGTDASSTWMLAIDAACIALVTAAALTRWRPTVGSSHTAPGRVA